jgi:hypothetical protein
VTSGLLNKIGSLEELVMQLKFEKNELQQKLNAYDENSSCVDSAMHNENETSIEYRKLTTSTILTMIAENELKEQRFKG